MKFHREADSIPTNPVERMKLVKWLVAHPLWTYPVTTHMPDDIGEMFEPIENKSGFKRMKRFGDPGTESWKKVDTIGGSFQACVEIDPVYVNPTTESIEDRNSLNMAFRVWIEAGGYYDQSVEENIPIPEGGWNQHNKYIVSHDLDLDCGAPDLESALCELAVRVKFYYGEGRDRIRETSRISGCECKEFSFEFESNQSLIPDAFCVKCGFAKDEQ